MVGWVPGGHPTIIIIIINITRIYVIYRLKNSDTIYTSDIYIYYTTKKVIQNNKQTK